LDNDLELIIMVYYLSNCNLCL